MKQIVNIWKRVTSEKLGKQKHLNVSGTYHIFAITKPGRTTTKIRTVFDASVKCNGISLNDITYQGQNYNRSCLMCC